MSLELIDFFILFVVGALGGILAGMLGIGGGIVYVIVLGHYLTGLGISGTELVKYTVANSIFAAFFAGLTGSIKQIINRHYYFKEVMFTVIPGICSAIIITYLIVNFDWYTRERFGLLFISTLSIFAYRLLFFKRKSALQGIKGNLKPYQFSFAGFLAGIMSSLSGLGGGVFLIPFLSGVMRLNIKKASSVSLAMIPFFAIFVAIYYALQEPSQVPELKATYGYISLPLVLPMALGVLVFTPVGLRLSEIMSQKLVRILFAIILLIVAVNMIWLFFNGWEY